MQNRLRDEDGTVDGSFQKLTPLLAFQNALAQADNEKGLLALQAH